MGYREFEGSGRVHTSVTDGQTDRYMSKAVLTVVPSSSGKKSKKSAARRDHAGLATIYDIDIIILNI